MAKDQLDLNLVIAVKDNKIISYKYTNIKKWVKEKSPFFIGCGEKN